MKTVKENVKTGAVKWLVSISAIVFSVFLMNSSQAANELPELQGQLYAPAETALPDTDSSTFSVTHRKTKTVCHGSNFDPYCYTTAVSHTHPKPKPRPRPKPPEDYGCNSAGYDHLGRRCR